MRWQCTFDDTQYRSRDEARDCLAKNHELIEMLDDNDVEEQAIKKKQNHKKDLLDYAVSNIIKHVTSDSNSDEVYAIVQINDHKETINLNSKKARQWLSHLNTIKFPGQIKGDEFYKNLLNSIIGETIFNNINKSKIFQRIAQVNNKIYYDLGDPKWTIVEISRNGTQNLSYNEYMPVFRRSSTTSQQVKPVFSDENALDKLTVLLCVSDKDRLIFKIHIVAMFLQDCPIPVLALDGSAGSFKSTIAASIKRLVDPNGPKKEDNSSFMSSNIENLNIQLYNRYMCNFDNVSKITKEMSDLLCRAVNGSSNPKRELYTNSDEIILTYRSKIILNGIAPNLDETDLQERTIWYERIPAGKTKRLTEQEFEEKFQKLLPYVLGKIMKTLCRAIQIYSDVHQEVEPQARMSDFEVWGEAISRSLGYEKKLFLIEHRDKINRDIVALKDAHPLIDCIVDLMKDCSNYENTMSNLFTRLNDLASNLGINTASRFVRFPKQPNQLSKELKVVTPVMQKLGYAIEIWQYTKNDGKYPKNNSVVTITKLEDTKQSIQTIL